jgi:hypothetical protein
VSEIIRRQLDALAATMHVAIAQIETLKHSMGEQAEPKGARFALPERCVGKDKARCAAQDGEWLSKSTLGDPTAKKCPGCGHMASGLDVN